MRNIHFAPGEFYHVYNRGVEKRDIFLDDSERWVFLQQLSEFNQLNHHSHLQLLKKTIVLQQFSNPFVRVHGFCLMNNHFHLLLEEVAKKGISKYMQRVGLGYTKYFNNKHARVGRLFENPFKAKRVDSTEYLLHLSRYIHLNPLDFLRKDWRNVGITNQIKTRDYLQRYSWSSYGEYTGQSTFPFVTTDLILKGFGNRTEYERFVIEWSSKDLNFLHDNLV